MAQAQTSSQLDTVSPLVQGMFMVVIIVLTLTPFQQKPSAILFTLKLKHALAHIPPCKIVSKLFNTPINAGLPPTIRSWQTTKFRSRCHYTGYITISKIVFHAHFNKNIVICC
jgi:hypothetical protein